MLIKEQIINKDELLKNRREKKQEYIFKNIKSIDYKSHVDDGWILDKELKKYIKMKKRNQMMKYLKIKFGSY